MSRTAKVRRFFGDGDHDFKIGVGEGEELQDLFDCGLLVLLERVSLLRTRDIRETLRCGLVGGGMKPEEAYRLVDRYAVPAYWIENGALAADVIQAALRGTPDEPLGEPKGETDQLRSPAARSGTKSSSASRARPASAGATSAKARSGSSARSSKAGSKPTAPLKTA